MLENALVVLLALHAPKALTEFKRKQCSHAAARMFQSFLRGVRSHLAVVIETDENTIRTLPRSETVPRQ